MPNGQNGELFNKRKVLGPQYLNGCKEKMVIAFTNFLFGGS
jgi:hypothetical protein